MNKANLCHKVQNQILKDVLSESTQLIWADQISSERSLPNALQTNVSKRPENHFRPAARSQDGSIDKE